MSRRPAVTVLTGLTCGLATAALLVTGLPAASAVPTGGAGPGATAAPAPTATAAAPPLATATARAAGAAGRPGVRPVPRCPAAGGSRVAEADAPKGEVKVYGHGWGHGMGMSQYGAQGAARLGCGYRTILGTYYRGSSVVARSMSAPVLLTLARGSDTARLDAETGAVRWAAGAGAAVQPKGSTWTVRRSRLGATKGLGVFDAAGVRKLFIAGTGLVTARHAGVVVKVRPTGGYTGLRTRWDSTRFTGSKDGIAVTEAITAGQGWTAVQKYLTGLAEVPVSWPVEALKAQAVAARTFLASKYDADRNAYVLGTTTADQVYRGFDQEKSDAVNGSRWRAAVGATAGQVVVDGAGRTIEALYSSSMGGHTENRQYVWGRYGISYLKAVDDSTWDNASDNPYRRWSKGFSRASVAKKFGFDSVSSWSVPGRDRSTRVSGVRITGRRDGRVVTVHFTGGQARTRLGLRSPGFVFGR